MHLYHVDFLCAPLICLIRLPLCEKVFPQKRQVESLSTGRSDFSGTTTIDVMDEDVVTDDGWVTEVEEVSANGEVTDVAVVTDDGEVTEGADIVELAMDDRRLVRRGL